MHDITILDGGMGKELRRIGAPFRQPEWSSLALIEAPEAVVRAHRNFIDAGATVITTNNYAVVPYHHDDDFFARRGIELTDLAGRLAREAADGADHEVLVAGSMPPLFGSYEPDAFDVDRGSPLYRDIAGALHQHVDLWLAETLSSIAEMDAVLDALDAIGADGPVWIAFTLPESWAAEGIALRSGETPSRIVDAIARRGDRVDAVLFNCSLPEQTGPALVELRGGLAEIGSTVRTGAYANAFPASREDGYSARSVVFERRSELTAERYADFVAGWVDDGATIVGGCCDMYPEHIAALAARFAPTPPPPA
ncbi:homocysteine S-methyltransferase family protein [Ilumatobacter sp.]|uniref:homocysteine S-methyltransferase family protein n=1 Tax=Ilumatobacter sp. TaxID=1967498 RepID=UPI003B5158BF